MRCGTATAVPTCWTGERRLWMHGPSGVAARLLRRACGGRTAARRKQRGPEPRFSAGTSLRWSDSVGLSDDPRYSATLEAIRQLRRMSDCRNGSYGTRMYARSRQNGDRLATSSSTTTPRTNTPRSYAGSGDILAFPPPHSWLRHPVSGRCPRRGNDDDRDDRRGRSRPRRADAAAA
jgi:hypothetical protein